VTELVGSDLMLQPMDLRRLNPSQRDATVSGKIRWLRSVASVGQG
jgi:hypothetical protein